MRRGGADGPPATACGEAEGGDPGQGGVGRRLGHGRDLPGDEAVVARAGDQLRDARAVEIGAVHAVVLLGEIERVVGHVQPARGADHVERTDEGGYARAVQVRALQLLAGEGDPEQVISARGLEVVRDDASIQAAVDDALARRVALKIYHRPERERDKLAREARTAVALAGSGVVRVYDVDLDQGSLVMEWLAAGSLKQAIVRRDAELLFPVERWVLPLARTLARVHQAGWVHADLKPANVMFRAPGQPVLSDFGLAHRGARVVEGGSVGYMSPARVRGEAVSFAEDVYGFGRLLEDVLALGDAPERLRRLVVRLLAADPGLPDAGGLVALVAGPA